MLDLTIIVGLERITDRRGGSENCHNLGILLLKLHLLKYAREDWFPQTAKEEKRFRVGVSGNSVFLRFLPHSCLSK